MNIRIWMGKVCTREDYDKMRGKTEKKGGKLSKKKRKRSIRHNKSIYNLLLILSYEMSELYILLSGVVNC